MEETSIKCPACGAHKLHYHEDDLIEGHEIWLCDHCRNMFNYIVGKGIV